MIKRFQIWLYKKLLEYRFRKNGKWEINEQFLLAVTDKFNDNWLRDVGPLAISKTKISVHYKSAEILLNVLTTIIDFIDKDENIFVNGTDYNSYPEQKNLIDYLTDADKKLIDVYQYQIILKNKTNRLVYLLEKAHKTSEIQYGYYRRNCDKLFSDILDLYTSFLELAE